VVFARIFDILQSAQGHVGVDKMGVALHKPVPLVVSWHGDRPGAKPLHGRKHLIRIALQDASEGVVSLLYLANDDGLQLATGILEVEVSL
jgi:hypothetical protein